MNLSNCLEGGVFVSAPVERDEPESAWIEGRDSGSIPQALYELYRVANYLSPSGIAGWETESGKVVSGYFARTVRSLAECCLIESAELEVDMVRLMADTYTPLKKKRGERWDPNATRRFRSAFRLWLIDVTGALDSIAELTAILLPGAIKELHVGRGAAGQLFNWLSKNLTRSQGLVDPITHHAEALHAALRDHVMLTPQQNWLRLIRVYRNKLTHFGHQAFINFGLQGSDGEIYYFLPREWPFNPEKYMEVGLTGPSRNENARAQQHLAESLVAIDTTTFIKESSRRTRLVVEAALQPLLTAFKQFRILHADAIASQINASTETLHFQEFRAAS